MPFEVIVKSANKMVATQSAADLLVTKIQEVFGLDTQIEVNKVSKTYGDTQKEVGIVVTRVAEYPPKPPSP